uniref:Ankyrin repeat protein n=1 Tax=Chenopodium quinoa TaxID=63459 RepID=A0A803LYD3_CHEQI
MISSKMDDELRNAAVNGDVEYLKKCVESNKAIEYYLTLFPRAEDRSRKAHHGNIFHMAALENKEEFIREVMEILPLEAKQQLLVQPGNDIIEWNPLHIAASIGNVEILKMFLDVYRCLPTLPSHLSKRPWSIQGTKFGNPCMMAVANKHEECALEIFKIDTELISNLRKDLGGSLVCAAIEKKMSRLAL